METWSEGKGLTDMEWDQTWLAVDRTAGLMDLDEANVTIWLIHRFMELKHGSLNSDYKRPERKFSQI